ncbi:hypothetical protein PilKf_00968 [Pillotina sp. SPG140]
MELNIEKRRLFKRILRRGILFLGITIITNLTLFWTGFLTFSIIMYIWTLWAFDVFEYFAQIPIAQKYVKILASTLSFYIIIVIIGVTSFIMIIDRIENYSMYIIAIIVTIISGILFIMNTIISVRNLLKIIQIYYPKFKERNKNNK